MRYFEAVFLILFSFTDSDVLFMFINDVDKDIGIFLDFCLYSPFKRHWVPFPVLKYIYLSVSTYALCRVGTGTDIYDATSTV